MKVVLVAVGAPKSPSLGAAIAEYESRIRHYFKFEAEEIRPLPLKGSTYTADVARKESEALLARVPEGMEVVAVDERGEAWSSERLAAYLEQLGVESREGAAFLIGGPAGLSDALRRRAHRVLALSGFTLPHELARLVLAEQLYRAGTIQRGEPYHRGG